MTNRFDASEGRKFFKATVKFSGEYVSKLVGMSDYEKTWTWITLPDGNTINYEFISQYNGHTYVFEKIEGEPFYQCYLTQSHRNDFKIHEDFLYDMSDYTMEEDWEEVILNNAPVYLWNGDESSKQLGTLSSFYPDADFQFESNSVDYQFCRLVKAEDLMDSIYIHGQLDLPDYEVCGVSVYKR